MDNWYYINREKSVGPLTEIEFTGLVRQGVIQDKTLVWNPSLPFDWVEFSSLSPEYFSRGTDLEMLDKNKEQRSNGEEKQGELLPCDECGKLFAHSELIQREDFKVCADCSKHFNRQYLNALKDTRLPRCAECGKEALPNELFPCGTTLGGIIQVCADCRPLYLWYYKDQEISIGPLKEDKFRELAALGVIQPQTMVWNPRMHYGWVKYASLRPEDFSQKISGPAEGKKPAENEGKCIECGKVFLRTEMISYNQFFVCANCKPVFIQKIKEGAYKEEPIPVTEEMRYAGFWIRFLAWLIDQLILYLINIPISLLMPFAMEHWRNNTPYFSIFQGNIMVLGYITGAVYEILLVGKYGATVGKMVFQLRVVTADRKPVSYWRSVGRHFAKYISGIICSIGYIMAAFDSEKRGLHDHICYTRVIKR